MTSRFGAQAAAALLFVGLLSGCGGKPPVAECNGVKLTPDEFAELCASHTEYNPQGGAIGMQVLTQWIRSTILDQLAREKKLYPTEDEVNRRLESIRSQARRVGGNLETQLRQQGLSLEQFRRDLRESLVQEKVVTGGLTVTDQEVRTAFDGQKQNMTVPEQIEISMITVDDRKAMEQVKTDLGSNTDFNLVASTRSKDPFAQNGGKVPFPLGRQPQQGLPIDQKVVDAAFKLQPGEVSPPVPIGATWVFVRLEKKTEAKPPNYEETADLMRSALLRQKADQSGQSARVQQEVMQALQKAQVKINRPEYQYIQEQMQQQAAAAQAASGGGAVPHGQPGHVHSPEEGGGAPPPSPGE